MPSRCELAWEGAAVLLLLFTHSDLVNISALQEKIVRPRPVLHVHDQVKPQKNEFLKF